MAAAVHHWEARPAGDPLLAAPEPVWRVSVAKYHAMIAAGILASSDRVELLGGLIVPLMSRSPRHCNLGSALLKRLERVLPAGWHLRSQDPITLSDSEPEPDGVVVRGELEDFEFDNRHPGPEDIAMVVEVSDSTLRRDQVTKRWIYSRAGIPYYWILNLADNRLEVYSAPDTDAGYTRQEIYAVGDKAPVRIPGAETQYLDLSRLLG